MGLVIGTIIVLTIVLNDEHFQINIIECLPYWNSENDFFSSFVILFSMSIFLFFETLNIGRMKSTKRFI